LDADTNELQQAIFAGKIQRARAIPSARKIAVLAKLPDASPGRRRR
jgi:hypothetical protein